MIYEIFTFGGGEYVIEVLNAIVRVMGGNSFISAIKISLLFGLLATLFDIAVNGGFTKGIKYYVSFLLAYNILFVPKVDVIVTDPLSPHIQANRIVDNVPFGLAFMGHAISSFGNWLTKTFEMNFSLPDDLQYANNGILFGSTLIKKTLSVRITDPGTTENFNNYIRQCIFTSVQLGKVKEKDLIESEDIATFLKYGSSGVLAYEYTGKDNEKVIKLCNSTSEIENEIEAEVQKLRASNGSSNGAMEYILNIQQDASKTFEQMLIANAIEDSTQNYLALTQADAAATNYALTKDDLQRKQTGIIQWIQANKYLPLLKITIESLFYALFPVVVLMTMLPNGFKIFKSYIMVLLSLQMWSPLYAVLNLIMTLEQKYRIGGILKETGNAITLYNKSAILDAAQGIATQAGILAWSIPVLAQKIVSGMEHFADVSGGIAQSGTHSASQLASEVSSGNMSYGNGSFKNVSYDNTSNNNISKGNVSNNNVSNDNISKGNVSNDNTSSGNVNNNNVSENNTNSNKHDTNETNFSGVKRVQGEDGVIVTTTSSGITYDTTANRSNTGVSGNFNESLENGLHRAVSNAETNSKNKANTLNDTITRLNDSHRESGDSTTSWGVNAKGEVTFKTSGGFKVFGIGVTADTAANFMVQKGYDKKQVEQLTNEYNLIKNQQKSLTEALNTQSTYQENYDYVKRSGANITRDLTDEMFNKKRADGWSEDDIKSLAKDQERMASELQKYAFSKFGIEQPDMYKKHKKETEQFKNSFDNLNFDEEHNNRKKN
jgi:conjugal transfer mating pair stabilization protein TraG